MKKLLFNGCSFVAGDDLGWDHNKLGDPIKSSKLWEEHIIKRKAWNLPAKSAEKLNTDVIDISMDGNSNPGIVLQTIEYISTKLNKEERSNLHVCIGWSEISRFMAFNKFKFDNINPAWLSAKTPKNLWKDKYNYIKDYCEAFVMYKKDVDIMIPYIISVSCLENFLINNNITYTFWRSLGSSVTPEEFNILNNYVTIDKMSNRNSWILLGDVKPHPMVGISWATNLNKIRSESVSITGHPNETSVLSHRELICDHVIKQLYYNN